MNMKNRSMILSLILILFVFVLAGCKIENKNNVVPADMETSPAEYKNMSVEELHTQLENKDFFLVDVHIPEQEHLAGTDKFIPYDTILQNLDQLPQDKNAKIVLYCRSGTMSEDAAQELSNAGYTNVYNVLGGMNAWKEKGYAVR